MELKAVLALIVVGGAHAHGPLFTLSSGERMNTCPLRNKFKK